MILHGMQLDYISHDAYDNLLLVYNMLATYLILLNNV